MDSGIYNCGSSKYEGYLVVLKKKIGEKTHALYAPFIFFILCKVCVYSCGEVSDGQFVHVFRHFLRSFLSFIVYWTGFKSIFFCLRRS